MYNAKIKRSGSTLQGKIAASSFHIFLHLLARTGRILLYQSETENDIELK